jgi:choline monooxygenase
MPSDRLSPDIDSELAHARTLPSVWYVNPEQLEREKRRVFEPTWQWVSRSSALENRGDFVTVELLDEPLVVARGDDEKLRGFFNVCRHRAGPVAQASGNGKLLQCRYHGWTYELDGRLCRAPEMEGVVDFREKEICLETVSVSEWSPLVFANLSKTPEPSTTSQWLAEIESAVTRGGFERERLGFVERREYLVEANWKTYVDNYLEGYHIPMVHPGLFQLVDYEQYRVETFGHHLAQIAPLRSAVEGRSPEALYYWVFPNLMLNFYPGGLQVNGVFPLESERTLTIFEWYATDGDRSEALEKEIAFSEQVQREDMDICAQVQKGLRSRSYDRGRFSVRRENGVHHFHRLLAELLSTE